MKAASELPAVLVNSAELGAITGPGDSVQMAFLSPLAAPEGVVMLPVFRAAMTRLAFFEFVDALVAFRDQLTAHEATSLTKSN